MFRNLLIDILDDFAFGSHNIEQTADRITELCKEQPLQLQKTSIIKSVCSDDNLQCNNYITACDKCINAFSEYKKQNVL